MPLKKSKDIFCALCGNESSYPDFDGLFLCNDCVSKHWGKWIKAQIPKNSKVHCQKCYRHINACICPSTKNLRSIMK